MEKVVISVLGGMSGRLFTEVREKRGLCYSVSAGYWGGKLFGAVEAYVGTALYWCEQSLDVLVAELERVNAAAGKITQNEFDRAIVGMKSRLVSAGSRRRGVRRCWRRTCTGWGVLGAWMEIVREIDAVTLDKVNAYLSSRKLGRLTIQTLGPAALTPPKAKPPELTAASLGAGILHFSSMVKVMSISDWPM